MQKARLNFLKTETRYAFYGQKRFSATPGE